MADSSKFWYTFFTSFGVALVGTGLALQVLYIQNDINKPDNDQSYMTMQIGSILINSLIVAYLLTSISFFRPYESAYKIGFTVIILLLGLAAEIYLTNFRETDYEIFLSYSFAGINALLRLYLLISIRCDKPLSTIESIINAVPQVAKNAGKPVQEVVRDIGAQASNVDFNNVYNKFLDILRKTDLTDEERLRKNNDFRALWGKTPLEPKTQGGRRTR